MHASPKCFSPITLPHVPLPSQTAAIRQWFTSSSVPLGRLVQVPRCPGIAHEVQKSHDVEPQHTDSTQAPLVQSAPMLHDRPSVHGGQSMPPQSVSVSFPSRLPFMHPALPELELLVLDVVEPPVLVLDVVEPPVPVLDVVEPPVPVLDIVELDVVGAPPLPQVRSTVQSEDIW